MKTLEGSGCGFCRGCFDGTYPIEAAGDSLEKGDKERKPEGLIRYGNQLQGCRVDVEAGYEAVRLMKQYVNKTHTPNIIGGLGGFGGMFQLDTSGVEEPVLVAATDGVGTKLKIAFLLDRHDTIGIDCVAMCVNDLICQGARPLFFLDYIATGKLLPEQAALIVKGVAEGCLQSGCALIGGETAEMPGFYQAGEYDVAGFAVGLADRKKLIDGSKIEAGDSLIGLASSGVHSNGFSLVRKLLAEENNRLSEYDERLGSTIGEACSPLRGYMSREYWSF